MRATGLLTELSLSPLDAAGHRAARRGDLRAAAAADADADLLQATTGGFPLYVIEARPRQRRPAGGAPRAGRRSAPRCCASGWRRPPRAAQEVAGLAAAVGTDFTLDLLTEASDLHADTVVGAVDELWRAGSCASSATATTSPTTCSGRPRTRRSPRPARWLLHRRVAQGLELLHAGDTDAVAAQLAEQYARGGRPAQAVAYYRRAAQVAAGRFAHAEAIRLYREALSVIAAMPAGTGPRQRWNWRC